MTVVLLLSTGVQLPGVMVNFERQEELAMQAGATFEQLLWSPSLSPLLTYWGRIGATPDPLWLQPYWRTLPPLLPLAFATAAAASALLLALAARRIWREQRGALWLALGGLALVLLAALLPPLAYADPRWDDQSAVREDNRAVMRSIQEAWRPGDVVLLDLIETSDMGRRTGQWLNFARREPYIGWLRKAQMEGAAGEQLAAWLTPYRRAWLVLQATDEGDAASTTEAWLNTWAFAGRRWWAGDQRVVEYLLPPAEEDTTVVLGPFTFGGELVLERYQLVQDVQSGAAWLALHWQPAGNADLRYSVQALNAAGSVLAQVDGAPSTLVGAADRIGVALPADVNRLILKVYHAGDGSVLPVVAAGAAEPSDFLPLSSP